MRRKGVRRERREIALGFRVATVRNREQRSRTHAAFSHKQAESGGNPRCDAAMQRISAYAKQPAVRGARSLMKNRCALVARAANRYPRDGARTRTRAGGRLGGVDGTNARSCKCPRAAEAAGWMAFRTIKIP